jgi:hypothetical protein
MFTNVNLAAPVGVAAFLATAFLFLLLGLAFVFSFIKKKFRLTRLSLMASALTAAVYVIILLGFSFGSKEIVLARGEEKHFCEIDCHLAYSIVDVQEPKALAEVIPGHAAAVDQLKARGLFRVVTIKTRFDETTIGRNRGDALLYPNSRIISIIDGDGKEYFPSPEAQRVFEDLNASGTAITASLRPGESYSSIFVFDLPPNIKNPALLIREGELVTHFVIGHENSPFHKKTRFQI